MTLFCSDLDNTMIFSHRHELYTEKILAEYLDGKEQSYITAHSFEALKTLQARDDMIFVPATTRTEEQYKRVFVFSETLHCEYALVLNGSQLLVNGENEKQWACDSMKLGEGEFSEVERVYEYLMSAAESERVHFLKPFLAYLKCDEPDSLLKDLRGFADEEKVKLTVHRGKFYCLARSLTKGAAVKRLKSRLNCDRLIAAGDGELDIPMLNAADVAFCTPDIAEFVHAPKVYVHDGGKTFSDFILDIVSG